MTAAAARTLAECADYEGMPSRPLSREQLRAKFMKATAGTKIY